MLTTRSGGPRHLLGWAIIGASCLIGWPAAGRGQTADIVFERSESTYLMDANGRSEMKVAANAHSPVCTADGRRIIFSAAAPGTSGSEIQSVRRDGSDRRTIVPRTVKPDGYPFAVSPDASSVVFIANHQLHLARLDRAQVTRITDGFAATSQPSWSPRGDRLVFHAEEAVSSKLSLDPSAIRLLSEEDRHGYFVLTVSSGALRRLPGPARATYRPAWSPDGRKLAVPGFGTIRVVDADDLSTVTVQAGPPWVSEVAWSPDGKSLAFSAKNEDPDSRQSGVGDKHVYVSGADGHAVRRISQPRWRLGWHFDVHWHPNGSALLFTGQYPRDSMDLTPFKRYEYPNIFVADLPGGSVRRLSPSTRESDVRAAWCLRPAGTP